MGSHRKRLAQTTGAAFLYIFSSNFVSRIILKIKLAVCLFGLVWLRYENHPKRRKIY